MEQEQQLLHSQFFQRISLFALLSTITSASCNSHITKLAEKTFFDGNITMRVPRNWTKQKLPDFWVHDPRDSLVTTLIGFNQQEARITMRKQDYASIENLSSRNVLDAYYKSGSTAKILAVTIDSLNNKSIVNYLAEYEQHKTLFYFSDVLVVKNRKWVQIEFHGPDSKFFRDTVMQMTKSITVKN